MKSKTIFSFFFSLLSLISSPAQQVRQTYEYAYDAPVYVDSLLKELTYPMAWGRSSITNFDQWRTAARAKVLECMLMPPRQAAAFEVETIAHEHRNGYEARKIRFWQNAYQRTTAYLLVPDTKGPHPAVVVLHDHGGHLFIGKEKVVRPFAEEQAVMDDAQMWVDKLYEGSYVGDSLAQMGYVVLATDAPLWGERGRKEGVDRKKLDLIAGNMQMLGRDFSAWITFDDLAATEMLASLPEVDSTRIAAFGFSMGSYRAWMLAALSDRIKCAACVCWMVTTEGQFATSRKKAENGGFANCLPGLRQWLDYPHIASLACPRPMLFISGGQDKLFPVQSISDAFQQMHAVWNSQKAGSQLHTEVWPMGHECGLKVQKEVFAWLKANL